MPIAEVFKAPTPELPRCVNHPITPTFHDILLGDPWVAGHERGMPEIAKTSWFPAVSRRYEGQNHCLRRNCVIAVRSREASLTEAKTVVQAPLRFFD